MNDYIYLIFNKEKKIFFIFFYFLFIALQIKKKK